MKRGISIIITLIFMSALLAGCSKTSKAGKSSPEANNNKTLETSSGTLTAKGDSSASGSSGNTAETKTGTTSTGAGTNTNTNSSGIDASKNPVDKAEAVVNDFITKFYVVEDYKSIDFDSFVGSYPKDKYTNELRKIAEEDALLSILIDRTQIMYLYTCVNSHINIKIISTKIVKRSGVEAGSLLYNYSAKLQLTFPDENKQVEEEVNGQLTLEIRDGKWTITQVNKVDIESIASKYRVKH